MYRVMMSSQVTVTGGGKMPATLRLTNDEQEMLRKKCVELNKQLIGKGKEPIKDSELAHEILLRSIGSAKINDQGKIYIEY